ncbi:DUF6009 family protein [Streptomyces sp. NPDC048279]|uniref:DUF6009 family protein n=1 Tax=Streptomyces sp. NPDC048279 TaxID=3154714 RepID=UPI00342770AE
MATLRRIRRKRRARLVHVQQALDRARGRRTQHPFHRDGRLVDYPVPGTEAKPSWASGAYLRHVLSAAPHDRGSLPEVRTGPEPPTRRSTRERSGRG